MKHAAWRLRLLGAGLLTLLFVPQAALAWGSDGHRIVARLGEDRLSPATKKWVESIAGKLPLALLATWPDYIRSETGWDFAQPWHFLTVEDGQELEQAVERPSSPGNARDPVLRAMPDNVVEAIEYFAAILRGEKAPADNFTALMLRNGVEPYRGSLELTALTFLVHFVGDVHQPLHVGRGGDRGGNSVRVNFFDEVSNLHSAWDSGLIDKENLDFVDFVRFLEAELAGDEKAASETRPLEWARESRDYRGQVYEIYGRTSQTNYLPDLSYNYAHDQIALVKRRLYSGGLRLAALLDSIQAFTEKAGGR